MEENVNNLVNTEEKDTQPMGLDTIMYKYSPSTAIKIIDQLYSSLSKAEKKTTLDWIYKISDEIDDGFKPWTIKNDQLRCKILSKYFYYTDELINYVAYTDSISSLQSILKFKDRFKNKGLIYQLINDVKVNKINKAALTEIYECIKNNEE
ncbi:hypothetical protein TUBRATIS_27110 [Tubulinosema ratisbonensis]|uniref:Uncharacterized protein n=1 Tax=Tubulinosema ratisbonensis TaxID=291195 RepID=A0A437AIG1_9MICR|nr:hypothetical protein TUBRATIS_27110 [Tubulinosema ratisbonensis]